MPRVSAFSVVEKLSAINRYKHGTDSLDTIARDIGVDFQTIRNWMRLYETFGVEGLEKSRPQKYSEEVKIRAVEAYLEGLYSQDDICKKFKIRSQRTLQCWIEEYNRDELFSDTDTIYLEPSREKAIPLQREVSCRRKEMPKKLSITHNVRLDAAVYCIENKYDYQLAAEKFGVSYSQVYSWVKKYEASGADGLIDRRGRRKDPLKMDEVDILRAENRLLKAENRRKDIEIEALKKAQRSGRGWG